MKLNDRIHFSEFLIIREKESKDTTGGWCAPARLGSLTITDRLLFHDFERTLFLTIYFYYIDTRIEFRTCCFQPAVQLRH